jgi:hypothetical protein
MLRPSALVQVSGLKSASQYNGAIGLILTESEPDNTGVLRQQVRLFRHGGIIINVRGSNIERSRDDRDWIIPSIKMSLLEFVGANEKLGGEDVCHKFAEELWDNFAELPPPHPLTLDHADKYRNIMMDATGHKIFWLALDAVGHHFILEKLDGSWRLFQSYVNGYTAAEWCLGQPHENSAWSKWGGGKILTDKEVNDLLDLIIEWQQLVAVMLKRVLLKSVPEVDASTARWLTGSPHDAPEEILEKAQEEIQKIVLWSHRYDSQIGPLGCTTMMPLGKGHPVDILIGRERIFSIPSSLYERCDTLSRKMTGEPVSPATFFKMLNTGIWWEALRDPETGGAVGFSLRELDVGLQLSEEEGIERAKQIRNGMKDQFDEMAIR